jgi:hypothetical protein
VHHLVAVLLITTLAACASLVPEPPPADGNLSVKIRFDLSGFNQDGLYSPPDGLRALAYEFCIPARQDLADAVRAIDPSYGE